MFGNLRRKRFISFPGGVTKIKLDILRKALPVYPVSRATEDEQRQPGGETAFFHGEYQEHRTQEAHLLHLHSSSRV